jgi:hypothetical protein
LLKSIRTTGTASVSGSSIMVLLPKCDGRPFGGYASRRPKLIRTGRREERAVAFLHYGTELRIELDEPALRQVMETIASHATRGGWVSLTGAKGGQWSILVTAGIPIWVHADE